MRGHGEGQRLHSKERSFRRSQPRPHLDPGPPASETEEINLCLFTTSCGVIRPELTERLGRTSTQFPFEPLPSPIMAPAHSRCSLNATELSLLFPLVMSYVPPLPRGRPSYPISHAPGFWSPGEIRGCVLSEHPSPLPCPLRRACSGPCSHDAGSTRCWPGMCTVAGLADQGELLEEQHRASY